MADKDALMLIADSLKKQNNITEDLGDSVDRMAHLQQKLLDRMDQDSLDRLEERKEAERSQKAVGKSAASASGSSAKDDGNMMGGLGRLVMGSVIGSTIARVLAPIKFLAKMVKFGIRKIPILAPFFILGDAIKDMVDDGKFDEIIESLKTNWNDKIKPMFIKIGDMVDGLVEWWQNNETIQAVIDMLPTPTEVYNRFVDALSNFITDTVNNIITSFGGIADGVSALLDGDISGIKTVITSIGSGLLNTLDSAVTNIFKIFGYDFGEDGSFLGAVTNFFSDLSVKMMNKWRGLKDSIKDTWDSLVNFFVGEDGYIRTTLSNTQIEMMNKWTGFKDGIKETWDSVVDFFVGENGYIRTTLAGIQTSLALKWISLKDSVIGWGTDLYNMVIGLLPDIPAIVASIKEKIWEKLPDWAKDAIESVEVKTNPLAGGESVTTSDIEQRQKEYDVMSQAVTPFISMDASSLESLLTPAQINSLGGTAELAGAQLKLQKAYSAAIASMAPTPIGGTTTTKLDPMPTMDDTRSPIVAWKSRENQLEEMQREWFNNSLSAIVSNDNRVNNVNNYSTSSTNKIALDPRTQDERFNGLY